jgi:hypothetical protein
VIYIHALGAQVGRDTPVAIVGQFRAQYAIRLSAAITDAPIAARGGSKSTTLGCCPIDKFIKLLKQIDYRISRGSPAKGASVK